MLFDDTLNELKRVAAEHPCILVAYSGGKGSRVILDLCTKSFSKVVCFYMYLVPGLKFIEEQLQWAIDRYKIEMLYYPTASLSTILKSGIYCDPRYEYDSIPKLKFKDVMATVMDDTGIDLIAMGARSSEGIHRRKNLSSKSRGVIYPIKKWNKFEVLTYCKTHDIPIPDSLRKDMSGVNLEDKTLLWLHDNYPEDFKRMERMFPYIMVPIMRRKFYGDGKRI